MTNYSAVLKELMIAGYEGAALLAAFERLCAAIGGVNLQFEQRASVAAPAVAQPVERRRKAPEPDRRQLAMMLPSDGGQAKAAPMTPAERQAKRRAALRSVTLRDINAPQVIENIDESRNVTNARDSGDKHPDSASSGRDSVTRGSKKNSPHTPLRKTIPPNPPSRDLPFVTWDSPLMPFLEELHGKAFNRFGASGRTVTHSQFRAAERLMAERGASPPLKATGS